MSAQDIVGLAGVHYGRLQIPNVARQMPSQEVRHDASAFSVRFSVRSLITQESSTCVACGRNDKTFHAVDFPQFWVESLCGLDIFEC
ncbi:hypothetical protein ASG73_15585 [Janibacter sp. Soil728]|nr:hypothetical protein ASG73_15585 [Janibacter sp. Soil728]